MSKYEIPSFNQLNTEKYSWPNRDATWLNNMEFNLPCERFNFDPLIFNSKRPPLITHATTGARVLDIEVKQLKSVTEKCKLLRIYSFLIVFSVM